MQVSPQIPADVKAKQVGYGLPCANCRAYYTADLTACPICGCLERVPANGELRAVLYVQSRGILASQKPGDALRTNCVETLQ